MFWKKNPNNPLAPTETYAVVTRAARLLGNIMDGDDATRRNIAKTLMHACEKALAQSGWA